MEIKYIVIARPYIDPKNPEIIVDPKVDIYGFRQQITLQELANLYPETAGFLVLQVGDGLWDDIGEYQYAFKENYKANVTTAMLEQAEFLGVVDLQNKCCIVYENTAGLPISDINEFQTNREALTKTIRYHSLPPDNQFKKPRIPGSMQLLTNDQVHWLTQQYINLCDGKRRWLDRHGYIEVVDSLDGTPIYFCQPYGDAEEAADGRHKIDCVVADILRRLTTTGEADKMPNKLIISQLICLGARRASTHVTGSHWVVRSVRLEGYNKGVYESCTINYLNSAGNHTAQYFARYLYKTFFSAKQYIAGDFPVANQMDSYSMQGSVICGDRAAQNAVCYAMFGYAPTKTQYITRDRHCEWVKGDALSIAEVQWRPLYSNTFVKEMNITAELESLKLCTEFDLEDTIKAIRAKVQLWLEQELKKCTDKKPNFFEKLFSDDNRPAKILLLTDLQNILKDVNVGKFSPTVLQTMVCRMGEHYWASKKIIDTIQVVESVITKHLDRVFKDEPVIIPDNTL